jgi:hypothetical protein
LCWQLRVSTWGVVAVANPCKLACFVKYSPVIGSWSIKMSQKRLLFLTSIIAGIAAGPIDAQAGGTSRTGGHSEAGTPVSSSSGKQNCRETRGSHQAIGYKPASTTIENNLTVYKPTTVNNNIDIYKPTNINNDTAVYSPENINQNVNITNNIDNSKNITINKPVTITNNLDNSRNININENVMINNGGSESSPSSVAAAIAEAEASSSSVAN